MKQYIKNRKNQNISVLIEEYDNPKGLVFVMHGLGGTKEQPHIETFAKAFRDNNYTVVRFDTTNTFGESDGDYTDATVTNYFEDLEDVIEWSKTQYFYREPFILCGTSLGGICVSLYAQKYPEKIKALAPISTVVSGKLSFETYNKEDLKTWEKTGWKITFSSSGRELKIKYNHIIDRLKYDLLDKVDSLKMPVLMMVGDLDNSTPIKHQQILFDKLPGSKEFHIIPGAPHTFKEEGHLKQIYNYLNDWIKKI